MTTTDTEHVPEPLSRTEPPLVTEIVWLDPNVLQPDPENPRGDLRYLEELADTMRNGVGVLEPITFREVASENGQGPTFVIVRGHRRREAAILAELSVVPCQPEGASESDKARATKRMIENLQRDDFTPVEEARGVQQLLALEMTEDEISAALSMPGARVAGIAKISRSEKAKAVAEKHDLSFDQALALAEFDEDKDAIVTLTRVAVQNPTQFEHVLSRMRKQRDDQKVIDEGAEKWKKKGYQVLDESPEGDKAMTLNWLRLTPGDATKAMTTKAHAKCPGRAVWLAVGWQGKLQSVEYCLDWEANDHKTLRAQAKPSGSGTAVSEAEAARLTEERRIHRAAMNAGRAAQDVRREFVAGVLQRKTPPKGTLRFSIEDFSANRFDGSEHKMFEELTRVDASRSFGLHAAYQKYSKTLTDAQLPLGLLARCAADIEYRWEPNTWDARLETKARRKAYLTLLISAGYTPSTVEKVALFGAAKMGILDEAEQIKAAKKAAPKPAPAPAKKAAKVTKSPARKAVKRAVRRAPARPRAASPAPDVA